MIKRFLNDETGLELSEYAVAAALIALACVLAFTALGENIGARIQSLADTIGQYLPPKFLVGRQQRYRCYRLTQNNRNCHCQLARLVKLTTA